MTKYPEYNSFGGGAIEKALFDYILNILPEGSTVLEFGSGYGTDQILKHYKVISVEHDEKYFSQRPTNHKAYLAPLNDGWYDPKVVGEALKNHYDLILVDGPPGDSRLGILKNLNLFSGITCPVIFDDVNRAGDLKAMTGFVAKFGYESKIIAGEEKRFAVCTFKVQEKKKKIINKMALYTVITGDYDRLLTPKTIQSGIDLICFTDNPELRSDVWEMRPLPTETNKVNLQRRIKILVHKYLPEYEVTFYVDGNMEVQEPLSSFMEFYSGGLMTKRHPLGNNIQSEASVVISKGKARKADVERQMKYYADFGLNGKGLYETGFIVRDNSEATKKLCQAWWNEVDRYTHRDQLSLPVAEKLTGIPVQVYGKTLFQRYIKIRPHTGKRTPITKVWYSAPADPEKNIGRAYNEFCDRITDDPDDWICIRDMDSLMWPELALKQIEDVLELNGEKYQLFGCVTNRLATEYQRPFPEDFDNPSVLKANERALWLHNNKYAQVADHGRPIAGLFMLFQKKTWERHPFKEGIYTADTEFGESILNAGGKIGLMQGLYVFHYYRFDKPNPTKYLRHLEISSSVPN